MNGRIDLARAEAVLAVIRARTERELLAAGSRLRGSVGRRCARIRAELAELRVQAEAALDFAEQGIALLDPAEFTDRCSRIRRQVEAEASAGREEAASDGTVHVVICGAPNAGKSSLLNRLAGAEHAIVNASAGTTRDPVGAEVQLGGVFFRLTDTAGLMQGAGGADGRAVGRAREAVAGCQLLLLVLDSSMPVPADALEAARLVPPSRVLCVLNKADLPDVVGDERRIREVAGRTVRTSALTGEGIGDLEEALWRTVAQGALDASAADCLFNARQRAAVRRACAELRQAEQAVREGLGYEFAAVNLRAATDAIGQVTGEMTAQDVLDGVFSRFCIGK
jgi:tRNA modification GTPase